MNHYPVAIQTEAHTGQFQSMLKLTSKLREIAVSVCLRSIYSSIYLLFYSGIKCSDLYIIGLDKKFTRVLP